MDSVRRDGPRARCNLRCTRRGATPSKAGAPWLNKHRVYPPIRLGLRGLSRTAEAPAAAGRSAEFAGTDSRSGGARAPQAPQPMAMGRRAPIARPLWGRSRRPHCGTGAHAQRLRSGSRPARRRGPTRRPRGWGTAFWGPAAAFDGGHGPDWG